MNQSASRTSSNQKKQKKSTSKIVPGYEYVGAHNDLTMHTLRTNGLNVLHYYQPGAGVVTIHTLYKIGACDESVGETGIAHMLEHMLFKPTRHDTGAVSRSMRLEQETGVILNANTWKDRTTYYFTVPIEYMHDVLELESQRMRDLNLVDKEFQPERMNVLSEFGMVNGNPMFGLEVAMRAAAFQSHPYGHETIGFEDDIKDYTIDKLKKYYDQFYQPNNTTIIIVGDVGKQEALLHVKRYFSSIPRGPSQPHGYPNEPKQEGVRRVTVERPTTTQIVGLGVKHEGFPSQEWFTTELVFRILADGPDSVLHHALVDSGLATKVEICLEPTSQLSFSFLSITFPNHSDHTKIEHMAMQAIAHLDLETVKKHFTRVVNQKLTDEVFERDGSLSYANELVEYVSANAWQDFHCTEDRIKSCTPKLLVDMSRKLFDQKQMTIGHFIGTK